MLDAESTDGTVLIAAEWGARTIVRPWTGFVSARRFALSEVETAWTFMLDADEALDPAARRALERTVAENDVAGYRIARTTYFCGRAIRGGAWARDAPLRLFRTGSARVVARPAAGGDAELHEAWHVEGRVATLGGTLQHDSYPTLASYRAKFSRYTTLEARGVRVGFPGFVAVTARAVVKLPWLFVVRGGWRDGWRGAFIAIASAAYPVVVAWKARA